MYNDQKRSTEFYTALFRRKPHINVPGMTEFILSDAWKLGLMPLDGIVKILKDFMPHPDREMVFHAVSYTCEQMV